MSKRQRMSARIFRGVVIAALVFVFPIMPLGCKPQDTASRPVVVLYSSVDETFLNQIVAAYEEHCGCEVQVIGDSEAGKTTGLVNRIRLEKDRPRADVFWSSEQSQTVLLAREGLLAPYASPQATDFPANLRDAENRWTGFALRARVVAYDPAKTKPDDLPQSWEAYAEPEWASRVAIANPLFGTTRGHMAAMLALWGPQRFKDFLNGLVSGGATIADGNSVAVRKLIAGDVAVAFTDSDDVITAKAKGASVAMIYPDMGDGGTMVIPNTVALVRGAPHPEEARKLIDYILSEHVEEALAKSESGNYPARADLAKRIGVESPAASTVGFATIADHMDDAVSACREILLK